MGLRTSNVWEYEKERVNVSCDVLVVVQCQLLLGDVRNTTFYVNTNVTNEVLLLCVPQQIMSLVYPPDNHMPF